MDTRIFRNKQGTLLIERFSPVRRAEHVLAILSFAVLVLTGFPQKFYDAAWSAWLLSALGGLDTARTIHRVAGLVFALHAALHLLAFVVGLGLRRMRPSLLPTPQDLRDVVANLGWYLGYREHPPRYGKFDYRQKFEYLGLVLGGLVMIFSGLALLFPSAVTAWLPGQVIAASRLAHSNEAMLALLVLVIWHTYGAILSPEVFPLDRTMWTGVMTEPELRERHALEHARLFAGQGEAEAAPDTRPIDDAPKSACQPANTGTAVVQSGSTPYSTLPGP